MELGYNTDLVVNGEPFHVQTEGYVKSNPRIDTLVYKRGAIQHRLSIADASLTARGEGLEETKRKIRQQHLMAVAYVQRGEVAALDRIKELSTQQDPFASLPEEVREFVKSVTRKGIKALADKMLDLACGKVLGEDRLLPSEETLLEDALAHWNELLADEELPFYRKQTLVSTLLMVDGQDKMLDRYQAVVAQEGASFPPFDELLSFLADCTDRLIQLLFQQSRKGSALADDFLLAIFTRQSLCIVRHLFEEAERRFRAGGDDDNPSRSILPVVLLILEDRFLEAPPPEHEVADILDRLNYIYARLDLETFREIGVEIARIREETNRPSPFSVEQREAVERYKERLLGTVEEVRQAPSLAEKLAVVNRRRDDVVKWERLLMLDVELRLALKRYHNANTELFVSKAQGLGAELAEAMVKRPSRGGRLLLAALDRAIRDGENIGRIVGRALVAEGYLATLRKVDADGTLGRAEVRKELDRITRIQSRGTAAIMAEIGRLRMSRRDQLLVARRLLEGARLTNAMREELDYVVLARSPAEAMGLAAEKLREAGGPPPVRGVTLIEQAIEEADGAWLAHGGESGFDPEFEIGLEAATLQRLFFPGRTDAAPLLDQAMTGAGFSFAEVKNRGGKPAFVYRFHVPRGRQKTLDEAPPAETLMRSQQDGRAREALKSFEREVKAISANLEIRVSQLSRISDELARVPVAIDGIKSHYRPMIAANRRLQEKLHSFEGVVRSVVDPLVKASKKAQERGAAIAPLILSQMASDDQRRELVDLLSRLFLHELVVGLGSYMKQRDELADVLDNTLARGSNEWDVLDVPKFQFLLVAKSIPANQVALLLASLRVNDRFFEDLKPRKAFRCRVDKIQRAVDGGLY